MASTDTRSGFRLPWGSNHGQHEDQPTDEPAVTELQSDLDVTAIAEGRTSTAEDRLDGDSAPQPDSTGREPDATDPSPDSAEEPQDMSQPATTPAPAATQAPRKPSRLITELAAAMRMTAETAREQALSQVQADAAQVVETIRTRSTEGVAELRRHADEDIAEIRDWSKAEIARIREETDHRITERKVALESEIAAHAAAIEQRVSDVEATVTSFEADMAEFFERLLAESDPARLATMAEAMPDMPSLTAWAEVDGLVAEATAAPAAGTAEPKAVAEAEPEAPAAGPAEPEADAETVEPEAVAETQANEPEAVAETEPVAETQTTEPEAPAAGTVEPEAVAETEPVAAAETVDDAPAAATAGGPWGDRDDTWLREPGRFAGKPQADPEAPSDTASGWSERSGWDEPAGTDDRESMMAAMEAEAAEAAEAGGELDQDVSELASDEHDDDPDAAAAIAARLDAFSTPEPSFAARLASLLPGGGGSDDETTSTQVVVTGLVSVASIASFKRHLGRLAGVRNVSVASGPDGEFVFTVSHRSDVSFRDAIPSMPGFAARITGGDDESVIVTARDPETEA